MFLLALVQDVVVLFILEWISMKEIGMLDSATCNIDNRELLLQVFQSDACIFAGINDATTVGYEYLVWLSKRFVKVKNLRVSDQRRGIEELVSHMKYSLLKTKSIRLENIAIDNNLPFEELSRRCLVLKELFISAAKTNVDFVVDIMVRNCPNLTVLRVDNLSYYRDARNHCHTIKNVGTPGAVTKSSILSVLQHGVNLVELGLGNHGTLTIEEGDFDQQVEYPGCPKLTHLLLETCMGLNDSAIKLLTQNCTKLQVVDLCLNPIITDNAIILIAELNHDLSVLNIAGCILVGDGGLLAVARNCPNLTIINCTLTAVTDAGIVQAAQKCHKLIAIKAKNIDMVNDTVVEAIALNLPLLQTLELGKLPQNLNPYLLPTEVSLTISEATLSTLIVSCPLLTVIDMSNCPNVDNVVSLIAEKLPKLRRFTITEGCAVSEASLLKIAENCHELTVLIAQCCKCITDTTIIALSEHCRNLTWLDMACTDITDKALFAVAEHCSKLNLLNIEECNVNSSAVVEVIKQCHLITSLKCMDVPNSTAILSALIQYSPFITEVTISEDQGCSLYANRLACKEFHMHFPRTNLMFILKMSFPTNAAMAGIQQQVQFAAQGILPGIDQQAELLS